MNVGPSATKGWWRPCKCTRHSSEDPWQPFEREPGLQAATNQHRHTERSFSGEIYQTLYLPWTFSCEGWEGLGAELAKIGDQSSYP